MEGYEAAVEVFKTKMEEAKQEAIAEAAKLRNQRLTSTTTT